MGDTANTDPKLSENHEDLVTPDKIAMVKKSKLPLFKVNLFIHKGEQVKLHLRVMKWLLSSGRFFVIFVELLTITAFVYRYKLDGELADLQDQIKEEVVYLQSLKNDEAIIRQTQFQISSIKQVKTENFDYSTILWEIAQNTPKSTRITNITFNHPQNTPKTNFSITGQTPISFELSSFIKALQKNPIFADTNLTNVSFGGFTTFTITGTLNVKGVKTS